MRSIGRCRFVAADGGGSFAATRGLCVVVWSLVAVCAGVVGCDNSNVIGPDAEGTGGAAANGGSGGAGGPADGGVEPAICADGGAVATLGVASHADEGNAHILVCSDTRYKTLPPSSGAHYPNWALARTYAAPVPWGFLMHALEHGAIVVGYNCPGGCAADVAAAQAWIDGLTDSDCNQAARVILAPDPTLDVRWAASAWTWTLRACSFDAVQFQQFFSAHYNHSAELICRGGSDVDWSAQGWCQ